VRKEKMKYKLILEYFGANFHGWQKQKKLRTVQGVLEETLSKIYNKNIFVQGASRTDSGVHAYGQVATFLPPNFSLKPEKLKKALNSLLPWDIKVKKIEMVPISFNPVKDSKAKYYIYKIYNMDYLSPFYYKRAYLVKRTINIFHFEKILKVFIGKKDFAAFCDKEIKEKKDTVRMLFDIFVDKSEENIIDIHFLGESFLRYQIRRIVGTALACYFNKISLNDILKAFQTKETLPYSVPGEGLYLMKVFYKDLDQK